jgi:DNA-binding transcriptional regulator YhcF (GntR family)
MTIDPHSDRAVYRQLADLLRDRIAAGEWSPDELLPSASDLASAYKTGTDTVRRALATLRSEGLITTTPRVGTTVARRAQTAVVLDAPVRISARMPSDAERRSLHLSEGVPLLIAGDRAYPADRTVLDVQ